MIKVLLRSFLLGAVVIAAACVQNADLPGLSGPSEGSGPLNGGAPSARFTFSPATAGVGALVQFDASASLPGSGASGITSYSWSFGDGASGSGRNVSHAYATANTFTVKLTVTNDRGISASATAAISVVDVPPTPPTAAFTFSPAAPGVGETVFFNAGTSTPGLGHSLVSYDWTFGDGGAASGITASHAYGTAGSYVVQLRVTDEIGQSATSTGTTIAVGSPPSPTANFTFSPASPGRNDEVVFDASTSITSQGQTIIDVAWNFGDDTPVVHCPGDPSCITTNGTNRISAHTFTTNQTFRVNLVVTDSAGRTGARPVDVTVVLAQPNVSITTSPGSPNPGTTVSFNSNGTTYFPGSGPGSFAWTFGDGTGSALANPTHSYGAVGSYSVGLSVTDNKGRTGTGTATVSVVAVTPPTPPAPPVAAFTFSPPSPSLAAGGVVSFDGISSTTPSGAPINNYRWNFGDGTIISGVPAGAAPPPGGTFQAPRHTYAATGSYTVTLTVTDTNNLSGSTTGTVTVVP